MSHTIKLTNVNLDPEAFKRVAAHLKLKVTEGPQRLFGGQTVTGVGVQLPGWNYPVVVDDKGHVSYDNYHGHWGDIKELDRITGLTMLEMQGENLDDYKVVQRGNTTEFVYLDA